MSAPTTVSEALRREVEDFLYAEADLLDGWQIEEWLALFTADCMYWVPGSVDDPDLKTHPSIIYDDHARLEDRVMRLLHPAVHTQVPRSKTRRLISNIRVEPDGDRVRASANFLLFEVRLNQERLLGGQYQFLLRREADRWRIEQKKVLLLQNDQPLRFMSILL
jgi:3-phenylpropionate/cinnamic acid dioxygenase small subunit